MPASSLSVRASLFVFVLGLSPLACKTGPGAEEGGGETGGPSPDAHALAECEAMFACPCEEPPYASLEACIEIRTEQLAALAQVAAERGLTWDAGCAQARVDRLAAACSDDYSQRDHCGGEYCSLYVGTLSEGSECNDLGRAELISECEPGSICRIGRCYEYCAIHSGPCGDDFLGAMCPEGQVCLYEDLSAYCGTPPGEGDYCSIVGPGCGAGLYCDHDLMECKPKVGPGEACENSWCAAGSYCDEGTCAETKLDGDACTNSFECQSSYCNTDTCEALPDQAGDSCEGPYACAEGLACDNETLTCVIVEPLACTIASEDCTVEFNGVCDEAEDGGVCEVGTDHFDCGYCPEIWTTNDFCNEDWGSCPVGSDPECP